MVIVKQDFINSGAAGQRDKCKEEKEKQERATTCASGCSVSPRRRRLVLGAPHGVFLTAFRSFPSLDTFGNAKL